MQARSATREEIGPSRSPLRAKGATAAAGSRANVISARPVKAFQNPITVQGTVTAKQASMTPSRTPKGVPSASAIITSSPAAVVSVSAA